MRRREFIALVGSAGAMTCWPRLSRAQRAERVRRVGVLMNLAADDLEAHARISALQRSLHELGWVELRNIAFEIKYADGRIDILPRLASELVASNVDVVVGAGTPAIQALKLQTSSVPLVIGAGGDPVGAGLVSSLARPGGNITGLSLLAPELSAKRLDLFKQAMPRLARAAVLWNTANAGMVLRFRETESASRALGVAIDSVGVQGPGDFETAFTTISKHRPDALLVLADTVTVAHRRRAIEFAAANRLPAIYESKQFTDDGGLMSYGLSMPDHFSRAAFFVDKIIRGAKPADLPVEQPTKFELVINLKTAKALGLTIPQSILIRADEIIQ